MSSPILRFATTLDILSDSGPLDAPKFKDYILPLIFLKRLSDVFEDEIGHLAHELISIG